MGLPGSGKTTLAEKIMMKMVRHKVATSWFNADVMRRLHDDWDFSSVGRHRQAERMGDYASLCKKNGIVAIADFVCPTNKTRQLFDTQGDTDYIVWMDTVQQSEYHDTDAMFEKPSYYNIRVTNFDQTDHVVDEITRTVIEHD